MHTVPGLLAVAIVTAFVAWDGAASAQEPEGVDAAALRKKAKRYEREKIAPLAYRAYAQLSRLDPKDREAALSAARCAFEMRAYARARKHLDHARSLGDSAAADALARRIDAGAKRDARWESLVEKDLFPRLMRILERDPRDREGFRGVFTRDGATKTPFQTRHVELKRAGSSVFLFVRTDSKDAAKKLCDHLQEAIEAAAKGWTADRAARARSLNPGLRFGDAARRRDPLSRPDADTFLDVEWTFPVKDKPKKADFATNVADLTSMICSLTFAQREIRSEEEDDQALRGFSGRLYTIAFCFDAGALEPAAK